MLKETEKKERLRLKRKRTIMSLVLMLALVFSGITPVNVRAKSETLENGEVPHEVRKYYDDDDDYYDSDYNKEDTSSYTPIYTIADLVGINSNPSGNYILMNDIDMTEETREGGSWDTGNGWTPLNYLSGIFDGNGYRIIGMHIYDNVDSPYAGLFSEVSGCIKNLGMIDVNIYNVSLDDADEDTFYDSGLGAITGCLTGWGRVQNCYVTGNISGNYVRYTGGLVGENRGEVSNSYNAAKVSGNGIVGRYHGAGLSYGSSDYCYNIGEVEGYPIAASGYYYDSDYGESRVRDYSGKSNYALQGKSLESEYTKMLTETQMRTQNMYVGFDFENTWEIDPSSTYPYPQLKSNRHQRVDGFDIVTPPTKAVYSQGEKIDLSGGTANIIYEGGYSTTVILTDDMLNEYDTMKLGEQDIFVEYGGKKTSFPITVTDISVTSVKITGEGNNLAKGSSMQLKAVLEPQNVTDAMVKWSSSDTKIVTVDEKGKVDALQPGKVEITATTANGVTAQYTINVTVPCVLLKLNQTEVTLYKGDTFALVPTLSPLDTTDTVSYKISNPNIATIDSNGKITGIAKGQVKITASAGKVTTICDVIVKRKMEDFRIEGVVDKEYTGDEIEQKIKVTDGSIVLDEYTDYEINYTDNIETGTATIYVTGLGYYEGIIEKDFTISKSSASTKPSVPSTSEKPSTPSASTKPSVAVPTKAPANDFDMSDIDTDFWNEDSNIGSSVYDFELPVPEIKEVCNGNKMINIVWSCSDSSDIDGYNIYRSKDGKNWNKIATINDTEIEDYEDRDVSNGYGYGYIIRSYVGDSESELSIPEYTYFLSKVNVKSVKSKAAKKLTAKWSKNDKASGYQIRISTTKSFTKTTTEVKKVASKNKSTKTIGKLKGGKKYFVQIRAYRSYNGEIYYSEWSVSKSLKVKK